MEEYEDKPLNDRIVSRMISSLEKKTRALKKQCDHKDYYSNPHEKRLKQYEKLREFLKFDVNVSLTPENNALINGKFVFALNTNRWRNVNKWVWYKSYGPTHFLKTYVKATLKSQEAQ